MENLQEVGRRLSKAMSDTATGPLIVAAEVVKLSEQWDDPPPPIPTSNGANAVNAEAAATLREQAGGGSCDNWIRSKVAPGGIAFFAARHKAVQRLGEATRRTVHHEVAVWVDRHVPDTLLDEAKMALMRGAKGQNGNPLTPAQAQRILNKIVGHTPKAKGACRRCELLEKLAKDHGIEIPE